MGVCQGCVMWPVQETEFNGTIFLRNFLFLTETLPEPSILILYWSYCITSTTVPDLSHFKGWGPCWFWMLTTSDTLRGARVLVCSERSSSCLACLLVRACSLSSPWPVSTPA